MRQLFARPLAALVGGFALSCASAPADTPRVADGLLAPCPSSPNCVSSDAPPGDSHYTAPLRLALPAQEAWAIVREVVAEMPRTTIVSERRDALHAECVTLLMRYVDDLELHLRAEQGIVAVRSASRIGRGDMGTNRERVDTLRARLVESGAVAAD